MSSDGLILVVDDDDDIREVLEMALQSMGYEVAKARDGSQAMALLKGGLLPALVLLDMMMPGMDGEAVLEAMQRDPALVSVPVVLVTGNATAERRAHELHAAAALVKPIQYEELASIVARYKRGPARTA